MYVTFPNSQLVQQQYMYPCCFLIYFCVLTLCFMVYFFSVETFKAFLQEYFDGALKPYIKSEPIPESNVKPVKVMWVLSYLPPSDPLALLPLPSD